MTRKNILLTGPPGCGKSTLIERIVGRLGGPATGFFTREIREKGPRVGFSITTLDGKEGVLAHTTIRSGPRVGRYGVNIADIDRIAVPSLIPDNPAAIVVIDEIGKMECFSRLFKETVTNLLESQHLVIGSIAQRGDRFIQRIREREDVTLVHVTHENSDELSQMLTEQLRRWQETT